MNSVTTYLYAVRVMIAHPAESVMESVVTTPIGLRHVSSEVHSTAAPGHSVHLLSQCVIVREKLLLVTNSTPIGLLLVRVG